jgi:hypothetical protein
MHHTAGPRRRRVTDSNLNPSPAMISRYRDRAPGIIIIITISDGRIIAGLELS